MNHAKIAFLLPDLAGGGAERVAVTLANAFARRGLRVDVLVQRCGGVLTPLLDPQVLVIDLGAPRVREVPTALAQYLREHQPNTLVAFMWPLTVIAVIARMLARSDARLVLSDHSTLSRQYKRLQDRFILRMTIRATYPLADARVIVSAGAADDLAKLTGIRRGSITVLHNPIDLPKLPLVRSEVAERDWRGPGKRILTVGSLKPEKQHDLLLRSFASLGDGHQLMILGTGTLHDEIVAYALELGIADRVALPGFRVDPWPYYASADAFVLTSRFEGLPLVLVEALHAGLPIVSTDCKSGPREILEDGAYGRLVPTGNQTAIVEALREALTSLHDAAGQRRRAQQLSGEASHARWRKALHVWEENE